MIDLHTHTLLSDGVLIPAEHIRRAEVTGYKVLGFSDHVDLATMRQVIPQLIDAAVRESAHGRMLVLAGVELTHMRPGDIEEGANLARELGAQVVIVHGETISEPVEAGTNRAAILAGVDILAHPGLITLEEAKLAAEHNVLLEISGKAGHSLTNGHVAKMAITAGAQLIFGSDAHTPEQMRPKSQAEQICLGAGLTSAQIEQMFVNAKNFAASKALQQERDKANDY